MCIRDRLRPVNTGHWGATITGNRQFQLPAVVEVGHAAAVNDTTVVMQPSAATEVSQRQQYDAGDPPALVMTSTEAYGQSGVRYSSANHQRGQSSGRGRSTRRRTGHRRDSSPDNSPSSSDDNRSRRSDRRGQDQRNNCLLYTSDAADE